MEMVKLINKNGDIIERMKIQYEPNINIWTQRGWKLYEEKSQPKKDELPQDQTIIEEKPKVTKTTTKKAE
tara:strand:+ start:309 stop:518 length:210 start_codon:yes stop_codon:yes gene_type:complete